MGIVLISQGAQSYNGIRRFEKRSNWDLSATSILEILWASTDCLGHQAAGRLGIAERLLFDHPNWVVLSDVIVEALVHADA